jgi:predicted phosphodiesterase
VAIFSDVHSDFPALDRVVNDAKRQGVDSFCCCGDIVDGCLDYPAECIDLLRSLDAVVVMGNHDAVVAGVDSVERYTLRAREYILRTRSLLSDDDLQWLASLPLTAQREGFSIVHASMSNPEAWNYVYFREDAEIELILQESPIVFHGHTHFPKVHGLHPVQGAKRGLPIEGQETTLGREWKYLINVGSVGAHRSKNKRASYLIFDADNYSVSCRHV